MIKFTSRTGCRPRRRSPVLLAAAIIVSVFVLNGIAFGADPNQKYFSSPEEAVKALVEAAKAENPQEMTVVLGPGSRPIVSSGDKVADREMRDRFVRLYEEKHKIDVTGTKAVLLAGENEWIFPVPIVKASDSWRFDGREGVKEVLARRIGANELGAIQVCLAYVDAQREFASKDAEKGGVLEYAQKFLSDPDKRNGLYWEAKDGEPQSPMGPLVARATDEGYRFKAQGGRPAPFHGYFFRILSSQGKNARGGAYSYVANGKMMGGFALIAYPARYGNSGIMTFIVNQDGTVFQKDLGKNTVRTAKRITAFDPDETWKKME